MKKIAATIKTEEQIEKEMTEDKEAKQKIIQDKRDAAAAKMKQKSKQEDAVEVKQQKTETVTKPTEEQNKKS